MSFAKLSGEIFQANHSHILLTLLIKIRANFVCSWWKKNNTKIPFYSEKYPKGDIEFQENNCNEFYKQFPNNTALDEFYGQDDLPLELLKSTALD